MYTQLTHTVTVFTGYFNIYFVEAFKGKEYLYISATDIDAARFQLYPKCTKAFPVMFVAESFNTFSQGIIAVSNSADVALAATCNQHPYFSSSIKPFVVLAISPVAESIFISSPHCEARVVVVVVQAESQLNRLIHIVIYIAKIDTSELHPELIA